LAITTALTLRAVFRLAFPQTEGLIGSIIALLGLDLAIPDHSTLSRRAEILALPRLQPDAAPIHLLVDSPGLRLCGWGEWLVDKHGSKRRRAWRKLHIGTDANTCQIVAAELTSHDARAIRMPRSLCRRDRRRCRVQRPRPRQRGAIGIFG
jgi:hypothetical protein